MSTPLVTSRFAARDGLELAWHELGEGRPTILIHGYFSTAAINWMKYGHAGLLADAGRRVIMPDLRGHGESAKPHDPARYPKDILADDGFALLDALGLDATAGAYDLVGYSLGGRTALRMMVRGARPGHAVLCGMGLDGILHTAGRGDYFRRVLTNLGSFERGSTEWLTEAFLKTSDGDPVALLNILETFADTSKAELAGIDVPATIVLGDQDDDNGSGRDLAAALPDATYVEVPGNHMSAVTKRELGRAIRDALAVQRA